MANPQAIFGTITEITRDERGGNVILVDGKTVRFDPADKRASAFASILDDLRQRKMPVYIETDPASGFIKRVYLPKLVRVERISETPDGVSVTFEQSHARHVVRRDSADAAELLQALRQAGKERWLAVTVNDAAEILDVRPYDPPFELPRLEPPPARAQWWTSIWWPWNWFGCVTKTRAQQLFNLCAATTCNPLTVPPPCIPFLYPDDGCWGRAHEMCRLMINAGANPRKVWIYGSLHTLTKNNPNCFVNWGWHVAPTLCVRKWWCWPFSSEEQVIDPSLFTTPVSKATWKSVQGDPNATFVSTSADVFSRWNGDQPDPGYVQTNIVLANYRAQLQLRSLGPAGPPPYANCP
jgi:hypothetical protein